VRRGYVAADALAASVWDVESRVLAPSASHTAFHGSVLPLRRCRHVPGCNAAIHAGGRPPAVMPPSAGGPPCLRQACRHRVFARGDLYLCCRVYNAINPYDTASSSRNRQRHDSAPPSKGDTCAPLCSPASRRARPTSLEVEPSKREGAASRAAGGASQGQAASQAQGWRPRSRCERSAIADRTGRGRSGRI
jgi:hypothetical protein